MPFDKESWYSHATSERKHEQSSCHKAKAPVPMDVSQMSSNVSKPETDEQESDSINTSKIRSAMETKCSQSRARARVGF